MAPVCGLSLFRVQGGDGNIQYISKYLNLFGALGFSLLTLGSRCVADREARGLGATSRRALGGPDTLAVGDPGYLVRVSTDHDDC
jgi:hypothetical protein